MRTARERAQETPRGKPRARRWLELALGFIALAWFGVFGLPAVIGSLQGRLARVIEERGLEPDGLFYTDTDEVAEAFNYFQSSAIGAARGPPAE